jgi:hypothetical protein
MGCGSGDKNKTWEQWQDFSFCGGCCGPSVGGNALGPGLESCEQGCAFVHNATAAPLGWKVLVPPQPAGGSWTVTVECTSGCAAADSGVKLVLQRVTFGEVFFCSGQSNQVLGLADNYDFAAVLDALNSGKYSNIRGYAYAPFSQMSHDTYQFATTAGAQDNMGSPWLNVSYMASVRYDGPSDASKPSYASFAPFSSLDRFGSVCFHFAAALTDQLGAEIGKSSPGRLRERREGLLRVPGEAGGGCRHDHRARGDPAREAVGAAVVRAPCARRTAAG